MPYDRELAERIRAVLDDQSGVTEKAMFGGLAFLVNGHLGVAASGQGGLMVRVDPASSDELVADGAAQRMVMRGRELDGWLVVPAGELDDDAVLERWVMRGAGYARSLPAR